MNGPWYATTHVNSKQRDFTFTAKENLNDSLFLHKPPIIITTTTKRKNSQLGNCPYIVNSRSS